MRVCTAPEGGQKRRERDTEKERARARQKVRMRVDTVKPSEEQTIKVVL